MRAAVGAPCYFTERYRSAGQKSNMEITSISKIAHGAVAKDIRKMPMKSTMTAIPA
jgi:hypothetical protein